MNSKNYPQSPQAWRSAIQRGLGLGEAEARRAHQAGEFPFDRLERWIRMAFGDDYSPEFVPALLRNMKGLAAWAYGQGPEPYWPGSDDPSNGDVA
jgi:hypothetical protein